jgi:hypothetical protein
MSRAALSLQGHKAQCDPQSLSACRPPAFYRSRFNGSSKGVLRKRGTIKWALALGKLAEPIEQALLAGSRVSAGVMHPISFAPSRL